LSLLPLATCLPFLLHATEYTLCLKCHESAHETTRQGKKIRREKKNLTNLSAPSAATGTQKCQLSPLTRCGLCYRSSRRPAWCRPGKTPRYRPLSRRSTSTHSRRCLCPKS
jgi:hypothetical protein